MNKLLQPACFSLKGKAVMRWVALLPGNRMDLKNHTAAGFNLLATSCRPAVMLYIYQSILYIAVVITVVLQATFVSGATQRPIFTCN
jgi:hypothetical protein